MHVVIEIKGAILVDGISLNSTKTLFRYFLFLQHLNACTSIQFTHRLWHPQFFISFAFFLCFFVCLVIWLNSVLSFTTHNYNIFLFIKSISHLFHILLNWFSLSHIIFSLSLVCSFLCLVFFFHFISCIYVCVWLALQLESIG